MIELSAVLRDLREELEQSIAAANGQALKFELGSVELEVSLALERKAGTSAKVKFWVVDLGVDGSLNHNAVQRVKLSLQPTVESGGVRTRPFVSGTAGSHEQ
ncbi:trypco2 family protein [Streptomyces sp. NPDC052301]|uniref:trypco2 family protein n=1 Tax=Streptomyces sp. NPDC052301 TaxID=3365687 RepID=UPI0037D204F0